MTETNHNDMVLSGLHPEAPLYAVVGACRSGTTALEKLLALSGVHAYHQPIKSSFSRGITHIDLSTHEHAGADANTPIAIKETLGAYSLADCTFDPLKIILNNAPDRARVHTVITVKEPFNNFLSWMKMAEIAPPKLVEPLNTKELLGNFILSFQTLATVFESSREAGLQTTVFDYESLRTQRSAVVAHDLLTRLELDPSAYTQNSWASKGSVDSKESGIVHVFPRAANGLHEQLDASNGFQYFAPDDQWLPANMHADVKAELQQSGVYDAYSDMLHYSAESSR